MKRTATALALAFAAAALLTGASVWEGAAVTAAAGELPDSGFYVATNAFPRNTVVDVKNLENDKTVRAIVSGGLDSPGLLASLSRDAAAAIDMSTRDIGRVRMTMPADPIAFSRFNEGFEPSGDPDHDPQAAIAAAALPAGTVPVDPVPAATSIPEDATPVDLVEAPASETVSDGVQDETPIDLDEVALEGEPAAEELPATEEVQADAAEAAPAETAVIAALPTPVADEVPADEIAEVPAEATDVEPETPENDSEELAEADAPVSAPEGEVVDVVLVPAEERPPALPAESELPVGAEVAPLAESGASIVSEPVPTLPPESEVAALETPKAAAPVADIPVFGAPVITGLEKGKYYLQLGAFGKAEAVEAEIAKHGKSYPLAVQSSGSQDKPVYRVLVGPVNLGESGALLQRFKRSGYKDAFVKQGS